MIQFNLLPDVKLEFIRAKRQKRIVVMTSIIVGGSALTVLASMFTSVSILQKNQIANLNKDIAKNTQRLQSIDDLDKILTVQNQLSSLPALHDQKAITSRLFSYTKLLTPQNVSVASVDIDGETGVMTIQGVADTLISVNQFVDTLKFVEYTQQTDGIQPEAQDQTDAEKKFAFSEVVLTGIGKDEKGQRYEVSLKFDPVIFSNAAEVTLIVPEGKVTTRSEVEKPLFQPLNSPTSGTGSR